MSSGSYSFLNSNIHYVTMFSALILSQSCGPGPPPGTTLAGVCWRLMPDWHEESPTHPDFFQHRACLIAMGAPQHGDTNLIKYVLLCIISLYNIIILFGSIAER